MSFVAANPYLISTSSSFYAENSPTMPLTLKFIPLPDGTVAGPLQLLPVNADVLAVHTADGAHVGALKRIGAVWKFKAIGYAADGSVEPGGGPLTKQHNLQFSTPDAAQVSARLLDALVK